MGISLASKNQSIDLTYSGMYRFRCDICEHISEELRELYMAIIKNRTQKDIKRFEKYCEIHLSKYANKTQYLIDFLFAPDCGIKLGKRKTKGVYFFFSDMKNNVNYGYGAHPTSLEDIKKVFLDGIENDGIKSY